MVEGAEEWGGGAKVSVENKMVLGAALEEGQKDAEY